MCRFLGFLSLYFGVKGLGFGGFCGSVLREAEYFGSLRL